jgi:hypothetical protein
MDVFNLMPMPGSSSRQLSCDICGSEIEMIIDEGGQVTGSMEDVKARKAVRLQDLLSATACSTCFVPLPAVHVLPHSLASTGVLALVAASTSAGRAVHYKVCVVDISSCVFCRVCWWQPRGCEAATVMFEASSAVEPYTCARGRYGDGCMA